MNLFLKILRLLPPEIAHKIALDLLSLSYKFGILSFIFRKPNDENCSFAGMDLSNRLGTAAGLDRNGDYIDCLGALGFGFLEVGTVTPMPQYGNPKPRVFRNFDENSIINRLGFNNMGVDRLVKNLKSRSFDGIVGVNVGANKNSNDEERINDYLHCIEKVHKYADYITVNVSSPNTPNLRNLQNDANLHNLVSKVDKLVNKLQIKNIEIIVGDFKDTLSPTLEKIKTIDFGFIDGNHQEMPTINYFEECLNYCHENSVLVFDDIHWSQGMENAWSHIKNHKKVFVTIDLFFVGIVFLNPTQKKEHFVIRY